MAVVIRHGGERALQGLRTALSLSLGDRPATVYLLESGIDVLRRPAGEVASCLKTLIDDVGADVVVETGAGTAGSGLSRRPRKRILKELARARFQQTF